MEGQSRRELRRLLFSSGSPIVKVRWSFTPSLDSWLQLCAEQESDVQTSHSSFWRLSGWKTWNIHADFFESGSCKDCGKPCWNSPAPCSLAWFTSADPPTLNNWLMWLWMGLCIWRMLTNSSTVQKTHVALCSSPLLHVLWSWCTNTDTPAGKCLSSLFVLLIVNPRPALSNGPLSSLSPLCSAYAPVFYCFSVSGNQMLTVCTLHWRRCWWVRFTVRLAVWCLHHFVWSEPRKPEDVLSYFTNKGPVIQQKTDLFKYINTDKTLLKLDLWFKLNWTFMEERATSFRITIKFTGFQETKPSINKYQISANIFRSTS